MAKKHVWTTKLQIHYPEIIEAALSPDGKYVVYTVKQAVLTKTESKFITHLYLVAVNGGLPLQLTYGDTTNHTVKWSPDSQHIAFLSDRTGKQNIHIVRRNGGESWALTRYKYTDVITHVWAPDGQSLAFLMPQPPSKKKRKAKRKKADMSRWDDAYDFAHVFQVPFHIGQDQTPHVNQLTRGRFHIFGLAWMPLGDALAVIHQPTPLAEDWTKSRLALLSVNLGDDAYPMKRKALTDIAHVALWGGHPFPSADGAWIACVTADTPIGWGGADRVVLYPVSGEKPQELAYTPDGKSWIIGWSKDGANVYVGETWGLDVYIWALPVSGEAAEHILRTQTFKCALHTDGEDHIVFSEESFHVPNGLHILDVASGKSRHLVTPPMPDKWPDGHLPKVEVLQWQADDGLGIEGYVIYPLDYSPGKKYPLILEVHGGPMGVFNRRYLGWNGRYCDALSAAERGFFILRVNPRGSSGYGKAFRYANYGDWGFGDYQDIMAGVKKLIEEGLVDPDRMGIMGWSYGGFMTSWAITQTDAFKAACVGAGVTNLMSFNGTSDIPGFVPDYFDDEYWDNLEPYQKHSPMFNVKGVTTPTLIQHGTVDERVPLEQGLQLYNALKRQDVPVKMILYPRQHHSVAEPRLRIDMRRRPIKWFQRWMTGKHTK